MAQLQMDEVKRVLIQAFQQRRPDLYRQLLQRGQFETTLERIMSLVGETIEFQEDQAITATSFMSSPEFEDHPVKRAAKLNAMFSDIQEMALQQGISEIDALPSSGLPSSTMPGLLPTIATPPVS